MTILLTNFFLCLLYAILAWFFRLGTKGRNLDKFFMAITFLQLVIVHSFVDPFSLPDLPSYYSVFKTHSNSYDFLTLDKIIDADLEPFYLLLSKIVSIIFGNFSIFLVLVSLFVLGAFFFFIKKYSPYVFLSILLLLLSVFNISIFILRQFIAIAICLFSINSIMEKKQIKFLVLIFIAFLFHRTAIVFIPVYYLYWIKTDKNIVLITVIGCVILYLMSKFILDYIITNSEKYSAYEGGGENSIINILLPLFSLIPYCLILKNKIFEKGINRVTSLCLIMSVALCISLISFPIVARISLYFNVIIYLLAYPIMMKYSNDNFLKSIICFCVLSAFFIKTFFTESIDLFVEMKLLHFVF